MIPLNQRFNGISDLMESKVGVYKTNKLYLVKYKKIKKKLYQFQNDICKLVSCKYLKKRIKPTPKSIERKINLALSQNNKTVPYPFVLHNIHRSSIENHTKLLQTTRSDFLSKLVVCVRFLTRFL